MKEDKCIIKITETCKSKGKEFNIGEMVELIEHLGEVLKIKIKGEKEIYLINKKNTSLS